jgi:predicted dehydrogenase
MTARRLRLGMVGGGAGSFIGAVHRLAARMDDRYELVAGALSSDPERAVQSAQALHIPRERAYTGYEAMAVGEAARTDRIDVVSVVTPNDSHAAICRAFLSRGIPVICDKPLTTNLADAQDLARLVGQTKLPFVLTHNYSGYPLVRQARSMVAAGMLGTLRVVQVEYPQDWLTDAVEQSGQKQAAWRTDPARSGPAGSVGDIGTHAHHLACFVTGLRLEALAADLSSFVPGRRLDDDGRMLLRFEGGARGMLWCSQVAPGHENGLRLRVYGDKGGLEWVQAEPNAMRYTRYGEPTHILTRGMPGLDGAAARATRIPAGHPEGYLEAFAQIYKDAADLLQAWQEGRPPPEDTALLPGVEDGVRGVEFITAAIESSRNDAAWTRLQNASG